MGSLVLRSSLGEIANPISSNRRIDWSLTGVEGGIVHRTTRHGSVLASSSSAATINSALAAAASGTYVELGAGTFSLSATIELQSNVTLRGQGMSTILRFTNTGGSGFFFGSGDVAVIFQGDFDASGYGGSNEEGGWPAANIKTWSGTDGNAGVYAKDATVINLSSTPTGLSTGDTVTLYQDNEPDGSIPSNGFWVSRKTDQSGTTATGVNWQGSSWTHNMQQRARVVGISGNNVTIWPGVLFPTGAFKTGNSPKLAWQTGDIRAAGLEDLYIDVLTSGPTNQLSAVQFWQASNCWLTRVGITPMTGTSGDGTRTQMVVQIRESRNCTVSSCWVDRGAGGGKGSTTTYGIGPVASSLCRIENNVLYHVESPTLVYGPSVANAYAYNYELVQAGHEAGSQYHDTGICLNLREGEETDKVFGDLFHGVGMMNTEYRLHTFGTAAGFDLQAYHRYHNVIGCVIAAPNRYQTLSSDGGLFARSDGSAFRLGYNGQNASINNFYNGAPNWGVAHDPQVAATLMRWGNYTVADSTARFESSEVPSGEAFFPNPVPSSQTLPYSLIYGQTAPAYFTLDGIGTVTFPPIGPDVTGGDYVGGRVYKLPAQRVYEAASGVITAFDPGIYNT